MLRITRLTDYGFILLAEIFQGKGKLSNSKDLAEQLDIPLPTVSKVLKLLLQGSLLVSIQGSQGGYRLAREASAISAAEIIEVLEGPVSMTACCITNGCDRNCAVSNSWQKVNSVIVDKLRSVSLEEMVIDGAT
ncbi:MAG TPA: SUF system Fe-S cluster assembly regulator [Verrucomicrobia bacterium]|nr:SUF system Fe-S cluster assembly regulator [Verrucomicrobiota bacterium]|tara:strand:- start:1688 stop:2089 length:402 start_codon:yes stop_codon:yes gene_type:complete